MICRRSASGAGADPPRQHRPVRRIRRSGLRVPAPPVVPTAPGRSPLHWPPPTTTTSCVGRGRPGRGLRPPVHHPVLRAGPPAPARRDMAGPAPGGTVHRGRRCVRRGPPPPPRCGGDRRDMRYDFLRRTARTCGAQWIATAHNAGDNAETILLHLIRGTGLRGLGGIRPRQGDVIRPLLSVSRNEIEAYLRFWGCPAGGRHQSGRCIHPKPPAPPGTARTGGHIPRPDRPAGRDVRPPPGGRGVSGGAGPRPPLRPWRRSPGDCLSPRNRWRPFPSPWQCGLPASCWAVWRVETRTAPPPTWRA